MKGIYLVGGYPDREGFKRAARVVAECGFDFLEVGIPFNDPVADGPVIAGAALSVIEAGVTPEMIMEDIRSIRDLPLKKYVMTYANIVDAYGLDRFSKESEGLLSGVIIADLPNRMRPALCGSGLSLPVIPFATLETREKDLELLSEAEGDFIYFIGLRGITGARADFRDPDLVAKVREIREACGKPIVIGFGIKDINDVWAALESGDGFVVGTEAVRRQDDPEALREYLVSLNPS
jgi:tryptophan synthase alpha chain